MAGQAAQPSAVLAGGVGVVQQRCGLGRGGGSFALPARGTGALLSIDSLQRRDRGHSLATPSHPHPGHAHPKPLPAVKDPFLNLKIFVSPFCTPSRTRLFHYFHCCNSTQTASLRSCVQEHGDRQCCTHLRWEGEGHCEGQKSSETPRHHLQHTQHSFLGQW